MTRLTTLAFALLAAGSAQAEPPRVTVTPATPHGCKAIPVTLCNFTGMVAGVPGTPVKIERVVVPAAPHDPRHQGFMTDEEIARARPR